MTSSLERQGDRLSLKFDLTTVRTDWIMAAVPTVYALRVVNAKAAVAVLALFLLVGFAKKGSPGIRLQTGPFFALAVAAALVLSRPEAATGAIVPIALLALVGLVCLQEASKTDARSLITSLIDGIGIYLLINLLGFLAGFQSGAAEARIGGLAESTGFTRVIFPLSTSLDEAPTLAAVYLAAVPLLIASEKRWRAFRVACLLAALVIIWFGASRAALFTALALPIFGILASSALKWLAPATAVFWSASAVLLPAVMSVVGPALSPVIRLLTPGRDTAVGDIESLSNRDLIWSRSIRFWLDHVPSTGQILGFGQSGQYRSGASLTYADILMYVSRNPKRGTTHNSSLQQLFDGGLVGVIILSVAILWACVRLSRRVQDWGNEGRVAVLAISALLLSSTVTIATAPGSYNLGFGILVALTAISCQIPMSGIDRRSDVLTD